MTSQAKEHLMPELISTAVQILKCVQKTVDCPDMGLPALTKDAGMFFGLMLSQDTAGTLNPRESGTEPFRRDRLHPGGSRAGHQNLSYKCLFRLLVPWQGITSELPTTRQPVGCALRRRGRGAQAGSSAGTSRPLALARA